MAKNRRRTRKKRTKQSRCQVTAIDILPDDVLLAIFDFCADEDHYTKEEIEAWQSLVHVCRRWRSLVFGSPRRLNLQLICTARTSVRDMLDVWPPLPLVIQSEVWRTVGVDNIAAALEDRDRVDKIELWQANSWELGKVLAVMQVPFPELTELQLASYEGPEPVVPDSFLGGSAPRLRVLKLHGIPFLGLLSLLLSATHLVVLHLSNIPDSAYISPEAVVTALSTLTSLESLKLKFQSPLPHPDLAIRRLLPLIRSVLPLLTYFSFRGVCKYLEDFVARIDAPRLKKLSITFSDIVFDASQIPQFTQFISRTPTLKPLEKAHVAIGECGERKARVNFVSQTSSYKSREVGISCREVDGLVSSLELLCTSCLSLPSTLENLYIHEDPFSDRHWRDNIENTLWPELLRSFPAVKNLYLSGDFVPRIVPALQELVDGRTTEVFPILQNIFLEDLQPLEFVPEDIQQLVTILQETGHPITVSRWPRDETYYFPSLSRG